MALTYLQRTCSDNELRYQKSDNELRYGACDVGDAMALAAPLLSGQTP